MEKLLFEEFEKINFMLAGTYLPDERKIFTKAFDFLLNSERNTNKNKAKLRYAMEVARVCVEEFLLGPVAISSLLLYYIEKDTHENIDKISQTFDKEVQVILNGLIEIEEIVHINYRFGNKTKNLKFDDFITKDVRILIVKIAEYLKRVREIHILSRSEQQHISEVVLLIYVPLAKRLGFHKVQAELEKECFEYYEPDTYRYLAQRLDEIKGENDRYLNEFITSIKKILENTGLIFEVLGREKTINSIWRKMVSKTCSIHEIYDIFAIRIIIKTDKHLEKESCWKIYSLITDLYNPNPDLLLDYVSNPRNDGYEALHTTVMGPQGRWIEVQIRSTRMDDFEIHGLNLRDFEIKSVFFLDDLRLLNQLDLSHNKITDISPLKNLKNLTKLNLSYNYVSDLTPLKDLHNLTMLNLRNNEIKQLPNWITEFNLEIKWESEEYSVGINFFNNPLEGEYADIVKQGREFIQRFFEKVKTEGVDFIFEGKLILVGEGNAGKTSLLVRLIDENAALPLQDARTRGIVIHDWSFENDRRKKYIAHIWDFGGQDVYYPVHRFFITDNSVFVLLASTRQSNNNFDYWIPTIYQFGGKSPIILCQTCHDGNRVTWNDLDHYFGNLNFNLIKTQTLPYYEVNLPKNNEGLEKIRETIIGQLKDLQHFGKGVPKSWVTIRNILLKKSKKVNCIPVDTFFEICKKANPDSFISIDDSEDCARFLHSIGVILWYYDYPELKNWIILQPEWAMNAVYKIIDDDEIQNSNRSGNIFATDFTRLWSEEIYTGKHFILKKMLEVFKIAFPKKHKNEDYIIPARLLSMPTQAKWGDNEPYVRIEYRFEFLPKGIVNQISGELSRYLISDKEVWNNAVNLEYENSRCQIEENFNGKKIVIKGIGKSRALIILVMDSMKNITEKYKGVRPELIVPCICKKCKVSSKPTAFSYADLLRWKEDEIVYCNESKESISIEDLLFNIGLLDNATRSKKTIKIFLASSSELVEDRRDFEIFIRRENERLFERNFYIKLIIWEDFIDFMSHTRLQDEYNKAVISSDIFISLFFTKVGKYTLEEFERAFMQFKISGKPIIYTFFKDAEVTTGALTDEINTLFNFKNKLQSLGHFPSIYKNVEDLKYQFRTQLDKIYGD